MTEKEKAIAYDEALKKASAAYKDEDRHLKATLERIFPELKESEDEKIRKEIISILRNAYWTSNKNRFNELVAWLEKQGKNSTDKTKSRFKVGDWVVYIKDKSIYQVEKKENCQYILRHHILGDLILCLPFSLEGLIKEWTIQDVKDGDVIHMGEVTAIFKKYIGGEKCICYCSFCKDGGFEIPMEDGEDNVYGCYNATPATKEQRDVLIKAMNDAGYKWNGGIKTLEKLVKPNFKIGDRVRHKDTNKDDVYEISKVYDDSYGIAGFNWMILMKYQDQYELVHNKFDPKTLKPFDKVLARRGNENYNVWFPDFISDPPNSTNNKTLCMCVMEDIAMVIPYNDETKHLIGTTDEAPEYYRYWE